MVDWVERIQEKIKHSFKGKPLFKFNIYDMKKLGILMKAEYAVQSYTINYPMEIMKIIPNKELGTEEISVSFVKFRGWGKNIRTDG